MAVTTRHVRTCAVPWPRQLLAGLSLRRPAFDPRPVHVGFVVVEVALGGRFLVRVLRFSPVSTVPPVLQNNEERGLQDGRH